MPQPPFDKKHLDLQGVSNGDPQVVSLETLLKVLVEVSKYVFFCRTLGATKLIQQGCW